MALASCSRSPVDCVIFCFSAPARSTTMSRVSFGLTVSPADARSLTLSTAWDRDERSLRPLEAALRLAHPICTAPSAVSRSGSSTSLSPSTVTLPLASLILSGRREPAPHEPAFSAGASRSCASEP
eukprot:scaffold9338_cov113-Isochrysis_galbana.AAC.12